MMDIKTTPIIFENGFQVGCPTMHQWDRGQMLLIAGLNLPPAVEFHFYNESRAEAIRVAGITVEGVTTTQVPNELLEEPLNIYAYVYLTEEEAARTGQRLHLNIIPRPEPEETSTDPDDPHYIDGLSELINRATAILEQQQIIMAELETFESVGVSIYNSSTSVEHLTLLARKELTDNE